MPSSLRQARGEASVLAALTAPAPFSSLGLLVLQWFLYLCHFFPKRDFSIICLVCLFF